MSQPPKSRMLPADLAQDPRRRAPRYESHALVDVRTSAWNPFSTISAVLLDLSNSGFKIEFVNPVTFKPGTELQLQIPLAPFEILAPAKLKLQIVVKWFDQHSLRAGGVFSKTGEQEAYLLNQVVLRARERDSRNTQFDARNASGE